MYVWMCACVCVCVWTAEWDSHNSRSNSDIVPFNNRREMRVHRREQSHKSTRRTRAILPIIPLCYDGNHIPHIHCTHCMHVFVPFGWIVCERAHAFVYVIVIYIYDLICLLFHLIVKWEKLQTVLMLCSNLSIEFPVVFVSCNFSVCISNMYSQSQYFFVYFWQKCCTFCDCSLSLFYDSIIRLFIHLINSMTHSISWNFLQKLYIHWIRLWFAMKLAPSQRNAEHTKRQLRQENRTRFSFCCVVFNDRPRMLFNPPCFFFFSSNIYGYRYTEP